MIVQSKGIVIKSTKYSESSLIVKIYTYLHGMQSFLIQGVYSKNAKIKPSMLQPLQSLDLVYYYKENQNLRKVKELKCDKFYNTLYTEIIHASLAMVVTELIYKTVKEEEANPELYNFLSANIDILNTPDDKINDFLLIFMLQLSKYLGFFPSNNFNESTPYFDLVEGHFKSQKGHSDYFILPPESHVFGLIVEKNGACLGEMEIKSNIRRALIDKLLVYYSFHVSGFKQLNSLKVLREVLKGTN